MRVPREKLKAIVGPTLLRTLKADDGSDAQRDLLFASRQAIFAAIEEAIDSIEGPSQRDVLAMRLLANLARNEGMVGSIHSGSVETIAVSMANRLIDRLYPPIQLVDVSHQGATARIGVCLGFGQKPVFLRPFVLHFAAQMEQVLRLHDDRDGTWESTEAIVAKFDEEVSELQAEIRKLLDGRGDAGAITREAIDIANVCAMLVNWFHPDMPGVEDFEDDPE